MRRGRVCDACLCPYVGYGDVSGCHADCPRRRGWSRGQIARELDAGRFLAGLHPQSPCVLQAEARLERRVRDGHRSVRQLEAEAAEARRRLGLTEAALEVVRDELRTLVQQAERLSGFYAQDAEAQPESEPGGPAR